MKQKLEHILGSNRISEQVDLFPYLSMRLHTQAQYFFEAKSSKDLLNALSVTSADHIPLTLLGGGSNLVFKDTMVPGLVVKNSYSEIKLVSETETDAVIEVGSGTTMAQLVLYCCEKGYSGLEYHKGLPGTVGGAVAMNSKWTHPLNYVGDSVVTALLSDASGTEKKVDSSYFAFAYDYSKLQETHETLLSVTFKLIKLDSLTVTQHAQEALTYRVKTQPSGKPTCGCFFQNISDEEQKKLGLPTKSAGYLIDNAGMKGKSVGSFAVSPIHANFIINTGGDSKPQDLAQLVTTIKTKVKEKFGVELKEEVKIK